jgi:hypothetical protein
MVGLRLSDLLAREQEIVRNIMKRLQAHLFSSMVAAVLIPLLLTTAVAQAQAAPWTVVKSPNPGAGNGLFGAASISTNDVWAVGDSSTSGVEQTLTLHWNGHKWKAVKSANVPSVQNEFLAVAAVSTTDVWAVGDSNTSGVEQALIEHWNGTSWSVVPSPNPSSTTNLLEAAAADKSSGQAWAVGEFSTPTMIQMLIEFNP